MSLTRRTFMKNAAFAGTTATCTAVAAAEVTPGAVVDTTASAARCPYFDQPLMCDGPDSFGRYRCDC